MEIKSILNIAEEYCEEMSDMPTPLDEDFHNEAKETLKNTPKDIGEFSDGYHTFNELYYYRMLYNAAFFNMLAEHTDIKVCKSRWHSDGKLCFGGGWFIVVAELPTGQISNHYEFKYWNLFKLPQTGLAPKWDGHTPQQAADRLKNYLLNY